MLALWVTIGAIVAVTVIAIATWGIRRYMARLRDAFYDPDQPEE